MALSFQDKIKQVPSSGLSFQDKISLADRTWNDLSGNQFKNNPATNKFQDISANIFGGGALAKGLGMGLAAPKLTNTLNEEQLQTEELQLKLIKRIREQKAVGQDTSRLENALKQSKAMSATLSDVGQDFEEALPTNKEVIGSALRLAGTAAGGSLVKGAIRASGILRGAGAGALSGIAEGAIQGAGIGLEQNKSSEEVLKSMATGGLVGGATGGISGAITGGISGFLNKRTITKQNFPTELATPKLTPTERANAIQQGRLKDPTLFGKAELEYSKRDKLLGESIKDVVSPKATIGENVDAIRLKVSEINGGVKDFVDKNKVPFNTNQLKSQLESGKGDLRLIFASDSNAEKTYNAVSKAFMENVDVKDTSGLLDARQTFDKIPAIKKLLDSDKLGENARKEIVLAVRRSANEYIASLLPKGNPYQSALRKETLMLEALGNLAEKTQSIIGQNKIQLLSNEYPALKWIVGTAVGAAGIGVGGALISSTD